MPQTTMRSLKLIGENSTLTNASPGLGAAGSGTSRSSTPSTASPYFTTWTALIATSSPELLGDALRRCRLAPQHEGMLLMALAKVPHPEVPREARPRRTHDILPAPQHPCPASQLNPSYSETMERIQ